MRVQRYDFLSEKRKVKSEKLQEEQNIFYL